MSSTSLNKNIFHNADLSPFTVQQSSFYGFASMFPKQYTQAVMTGESEYFLYEMFFFCIIMYQVRVQMYIKLYKFSFLILAQNVHHELIVFRKNLKLMKLIIITKMFL